MASRGESDIDLCRALGSAEADLCAGHRALAQARPARYRHLPGHLLYSFAAGRQRGYRAALAADFRYRWPGEPGTESHRHPCQHQLDFKSRYRALYPGDSGNLAIWFANADLSGGPQADTPGILRSRRYRWREPDEMLFRDYVAHAHTFDFL